MVVSGLLGGQYRHLFRHRELAEYMREGDAKSRRAILRWRSDQIRYERPQVPHALRHCRRCALAEVEDTAHVLLRCPTFAAERAQLVAAVHAALSPAVCLGGYHGGAPEPVVAAAARRRAAGRTILGGVRALTESHPGFPQLFAPARLSAGQLQGCFGSRRASVRGTVDTGEYPVQRIWRDP
jgi:hypothetical protein